MSVSTFNVEQQTCFQFKAGFFPCTILQLTRDDLKELEQQLISTLNKAPHFFSGSPVVIDLEKVNTLSKIDFRSLKQLLKIHGLVPIGVRGASLEQEEAVLNAELSILTTSKLNVTEREKVKVEEKQAKTTKIITTPIRSGVQVYAKESDLIIMAAVSPGAELFADGHIHVYGVLRGRALAGVQGNKEARIFCRSLEAELVSIAGYYLTKEDIQALSLPEGMMQIYLDNEQIRIEAI